MRESQKKVRSIYGTEVPFEGRLRVSFLEMNKLKPDWLRLGGVRVGISYTEASLNGLTYVS